ncbi:hypothetical protein Emtol_1488 [Emticicia oligotrophica DSM 17448]|uniref:DUF4468 domain-containing protein n=1 Tax=Emticicia oligotrophica (strain DSM 17448 / CIP 109782 / MTCC 6937 / GPTSA100-15) TaxID=929562 RepID=A0ABM5MZQ5_EMTOG|nr:MULTISPECIES: hypothetical protein [Emticicia]AFK02634.1 hypothetical protein Emtol_1488 [Emticicia oligotrophica DSM 17448]
MKKHLLSICLLLSIQASFAQSSLKSNTDWLAGQLNRLVTDDSHGKEKNTKPVFSFLNDKMNMNVKAKEEGFSMNFNISWHLRDVRKVSYKKQKDGFYELVLDVPADRVKVDLGFGKDNTIGGSFNVNDDDKRDSHTSFTLETKDELVVKEIAYRFENAVREARR